MILCQHEEVYLYNHLGPYHGPHHRLICHLPDNEAETTRGKNQMGIQ